MFRDARENLQEEGVVENGIALPADCSLGYLWGIFQEKNYPHNTGFAY